MLKPIVKWAGGKRQIMSKIIQYFPEEYGNYYEPFAGGLSVFMELCNKNKLENKSIYLSDIMSPLINLYNVIKSNCDELIKELESGCYKNEKEVFLKKRETFNKLKIGNITENIKLAALFLYLNKVGFNGMYRENKKGEYNIPFGKQTNPCILEKDNARRLSKCLKEYDITIKCCDYLYILNLVSENDLIYLDPPYHDTFTSYTKEKFNERNQKEVKELVDNLTKKKCKVVVSNSDTKFIRELYKEYRIHTIEVKRFITSKACDRKDMKTEVLITNF